MTKIFTLTHIVSPLLIGSCVLYFCYFSDCSKNVSLQLEYQLHAGKYFAYIIKCYILIPKTVSRT